MTLVGMFEKIPWNNIKKMCNIVVRKVVSSNNSGNYTGRTWRTFFYTVYIFFQIVSNTEENGQCLFIPFNN
jgi:hypothetical protein